jgi:HNH endonuclease
MVWWKGKKRLVHRVVYELMKGPIPNGMTLDHLCRVEPCINTDHLEPVSMKTNIRRGDGLAGRNARKTHCRNGHPFSIENTYIYPNGNRSCRICGRAMSNAWYRKMHELKL